LDYGQKGTFVLEAADTESNELREYICTVNESRGSLPSSDLSVGDMFVYTGLSTFRYKSVMLSLVQQYPRSLASFVVGFKAAGKDAVE
jgi:hypothetical protein